MVDRRESRWKGKKVDEQAGRQLDTLAGSGKADEKAGGYADR
jgi:hypothetical protein